MSQAQKETVLEPLTTTNNVHVYMSKQGLHLPSVKSFSYTGPEIKENKV